MHDYGEHEPHDIDQKMSLATVHFLSRVVAMDPPFSVVLTDWLSIMAALGWRLRPAFTRTSPRSLSWMRFHVPSFRHFPK
jgi:hypothetical protein